MLFFRFYIILVLCSSCYGVKYSKLSRAISITDTIEVTGISNHIDQIINPYKVKHDSVMSEIICSSDTPMPKLKHIQESLLGNFVADLTFGYVNNEADFALINFGGLRTSIPKGAITKEKLFELMPFENKLVTVEIDSNNMKRLIKYVIRVGGQPVSNIKIHVQGSDTLTLIDMKPREKRNSFKVITTDYLSAGGDYMDFFLDPLSIKTHNFKLRDAIISHCKNINDSGRKITSRIEERIKIN